MTNDVLLSEAWQRIRRRERWKTLAGLTVMTFAPLALILLFNAVASWLTVPPPWQPVGGAVAANLGIGIGAIVAFRYC